MNSQFEEEEVLLFGLVDINQLQNVRMPHPGNGVSENTKQKKTGVMNQTGDNVQICHSIRGTTETPVGIIYNNNLERKRNLEKTTSNCTIFCRQILRLFCGWKDLLYLVIKRDWKMFLSFSSFKQIL